MRKKINKYGFTLIEVIITLAVLCILSGVGFYSFRGMVASSNLKSFCEMLYSDILTSQQIAMSEGRNYIIHFDKKSYSIFKEGEENITTRKTLPYVEIKETTFSKKSPGKDRLLFFANTGTPSWGGTIIVVNDLGKERCVVVSPFYGRVKISEGGTKGCPPY